MAIDWFDVRSGNNHNFKLLEDKADKFISKVIFYPSRRIGRNSNLKDIMAISNFSGADVDNVNYGEGIARLKVLKMMKEAGIRGQSNGFNKNGKRQHFALKIEHTHREIKNVYDPLFRLNDLMGQEIQKEEQWNITKKLFRHKQISILRESFRLPASL